MDLDHARAQLDQICHNVPGMPAIYHVQKLTGIVRQLLELVATLDDCLARERLRADDLEERLDHPDWRERT